MKIATLSIIFTILLSSCSAQEKPIKYKSVTLKEFTGNQLPKTIPISFNIPESYSKMKTPQTADVSAYWMPKEKFEQVEKSGDLPVDSGHIWGKISQDVGYYGAQNKFSNEETVVREHKKFGFEVKNLKRTQKGKYQLFSYLAIERKSGKRIYGLYLSLNISTNAYYISYRPPNESKLIGDKVWEQLLHSIKLNDKKVEPTVSANASQARQSLDLER